jgi:predicted amidohydrolase YtcJ
MTRIFILLIAVLILASPQKTIDADLILHNGTIWTVDQKNPSVQAVAVQPKEYLNTVILYTIISGKIVYKKSA